MHDSLYDQNDYHSGGYDDDPNWVPSMVGIRATYATDYYMTEVNGEVSAEDRAAAFDRWLSAHDATIRTEQAERDAGIAERLTEWNGELATQSTLLRDSTGTEVAAAIRDAAKEGQ